MRKAVRLAAIVLLVLTLGYLMINLGLLLWASRGIGNGAASIGIIGGADGPTAIFITRRPAGIAEILLPVLGLALPIGVLLLTRKK